MLFTKVHIYHTGLNIDYMFCKSNGHNIYSSSAKLGKWY